MFRVGRDCLCSIRRPVGLVLVVIGLIILVLQLLSMPSVRSSLSTNVINKNGSSTGSKKSEATTRQTGPESRSNKPRGFKRRLASVVLCHPSNDFSRSLADYIGSLVCGNVSNSAEQILYFVYTDDSQQTEITAAVERAKNKWCSDGAQTAVAINFRSINDRKKAVRSLNDFLVDAYLNDVDYFRIVFLSNASASHLLSVHEAVTMLDGMPIGGHGLIAELSPSSLLASLVFGSSHFDIFGWFLPLKSASIKTSAQLVYDLYEERKMVRTLRNGNGVTDVRWGSDTKEHAQTLRRYLNAKANSSCWRCPPTANMTKVIAMSLYGSGLRYTIGAIRNAQLLPVIFPGWRLWVYCELRDTGTTKYGRIPDSVLRRLSSLGAELRGVDASKLAPMLWRFQVAVDKEVSVFTIRDSDSRLTPRDASVVEDWLRHPDAAFHCIRDHPSHSGFAVSGGLWGGRVDQLGIILKDKKVFDKDMKRFGASYIQDMNFMCNVVWPLVRDRAFCHDSFSCDRFPSSHPFPVERIGSEHIGEVYDQYSIGRQIDIDILMRTRVNSKCVPPKLTNTVS